MAIWNDPQPGSGYGTQPGVSAAFGARSVGVDAGLRRFMLQVYNYMASGVLLSGIVAIAFSQWLMADQAHIAAVFGSPLRYVIMFAPLVFVMFMSFGINRIATGTL